MTLLPQLFDFSMVPPRWQLCFLTNCPRHGQCLRYAVGQHVPDGMLMGPAVYPPSFRNGSCRYFKQLRMVSVAWGFDALFKEVKQADFTPLRNSIKRYLGGHGTYYRYEHGERLLTPTQQTDILNLFKQRGYTQDMHFDHYKEVIDFSFEQAPEAV